MRALILLLLVSIPAHARLNMCNFSTDFAETYYNARDTLAKNIAAKRARGEAVAATGTTRSLNSGKNWPKLSLQGQIDQYYPNEAVKIIDKGNGKILIRPENMTTDRPVIIVDVSGDYFRVFDGKPKLDAAGNFTGEIRETQKYYQPNGQPLPPNPGTMSAGAWLDQNATKTHFRLDP